MGSERGDSVNKWTYFTEDEVQGLDQELIAKLDQARHLSGIPYILTSTLRSIEENQAAGGVQDSAHLTGQAVDIRVTDAYSRFQITRGLILVGFKRLGLYSGHVHVDISQSLPQSVIWIKEIA